MSSWRTRATVSTGLHARRATGLTVAEREEIFTRTESVARWWREGRAAYERLREALLFDFLFLTGARCSNEARNNYIGGDGDFLFLFSNFRFHFHCFCGAAVPCCACSFRTYQNKKKSMYVRTCMRRPGWFPGWSMELLAFASRQVARLQSMGNDLIV